MNLPFVKNKEPQKNYFLSLLIKPFAIGAILFEEIDGKLYILANHEVGVDKNANELSDEELLKASDEAISYVEASVPKGGVLEKTIFSVPYDWITAEGKIDQKGLARLKVVCSELGLVPMGYLTSIEAVVSFLGHKEGVPVSALFVEVAKQNVYVYLVKAGKVVEFNEGQIEKNLITSVDSLFQKLNTDVLPSKIILLEYKDAEGVQQEFVSHTWSKEVPFLHLPQVMVLERGFENEATVNGVASQMDLEVLEDLKTTQDTPHKEDLLEEASGSEFGFVKEGDVADKIEEEKAASSAVEEKVQDENIENIREIGEGREKEPSVQYFKKNDGMAEDLGDIESEEAPKERHLTLPTLPISFVKNIKFPRLPVVTGGGSSKYKIVALVLGVILVIAAISFVYYTTILKADILITADKKAINKSESISFSQNPSDDKTIKISLIDEEAKGSDTVNATGTKETGDEAKGEVTLYNKTEDKKTFSKGTIVVGPNSLEFATTDDITIASTSSFSTTLSNGDVKIQASKFGKEYNLPSSSNFTVKGYSSSDFIGKNSSAITGGTKKETTVVSKKDLATLLTSVTDNLEKDAINKATSSLGSSDNILPKALGSEVTDDNYSKKEGDEAGSVSVDATIKYTLGKYSKDEIQKVIDSMSSGEIPGTYVINQGESKVDITDIQIGKDDSASAKLSVNAVYVPKIDTGALAQNVAGKSQNSVIDQIRSIPGVTDVTINYSRQLPIFPKFLPRSAKNITVDVSN
ncbi:MAG TPA: baseplate J/gp47 family protein [Patescibacteria group bacterium]|nr:baseplate J/gp47 family protein [Patescibacteria group bacterium]